MRHGARSGASATRAADMTPSMGVARHPALLAALLLAASACSSAAVSDQAPALIATPAPACQAQLEGVIGEALGGPVSLTPTALTTSSRLLVEPRQLRDAEGRQRDGRLLGRPHAFDLLLSEGKCLLEETQTGKRSALGSCACRPQQP